MKKLIIIKILIWFFFIVPSGMFWFLVRPQTNETLFNLILSTALLFSFVGALTALALIGIAKEITTSCQNILLHLLTQVFY